MEGDHDEPNATSQPDFGETHTNEKRRPGVRHCAYDGDHREPTGAGSDLHHHLHVSGWQSTTNRPGRRLQRKPLWWDFFPRNNLSTHTEPRRELDLQSPLRFSRVWAQFSADPRWAR